MMTHLTTVHANQPETAEGRADSQPAANAELLDKLAALSQEVDGVLAPQVETADQADSRLVRDVPLAELQQRAGGLARTFGRRCHFSGREWRVHWEDMKQTALLAFLEQNGRPLPYAYGAARIALKNYIWVHVRGLNGGWKSLAARQYTLMDTADSIDMDDETGDDNLAWRLRAERTRDLVPRPVEWAVEGREGLRPPEVADLFRHILTLLVGMSSQRWYPEQMYRAALILALRLTQHPWEEVMAAVGDLEWEEVVGIFQEYRREHLRPFAALAPLGQEVVLLRGQLRVQWFETVSEGWLRQAQRKIVVLPHGIYTITYRRGKGGRLDASIQKGRRVDGKIVTRAVHLGRAAALTKAKLWQRSLALERKLAGFLEEATGNLGRINESRQVMFGVI